MHQLLQTQQHGASSITQVKHDSQNSVQINEIISLSSFEIVKHLKMPVPVYVVLLIIEILYMILTPAQKMILDEPIVTALLFEQITAFNIYLICIGITMIMFLQIVFIVVRGRNLKYQQSAGNESSGVQEGSIIYYLNKFSGIFLTVFSTALSQLFMRMIIENFNCDKKYEIQLGCDSRLRQIAQYFSYVSIVLIFIICAFSDNFLTKLFPNDQIPWSSWNEKSRSYRNYYKALQVSALSLIPPSYEVFINGGLIFIAYTLISNRYEIPQVYNRVVHVTIVILECQLFTFSFFAFLVAVLNFKMTGTGLIFVALIGLFMAILMIYKIDTNEHEILSVSSDIKHFEDASQIELYLVVMLHELERLTQSEEYAHEKHVHAIVGRHMEECQKESCPCKNYEPEYDKKFTTQLFSRRFTTKQFSMGFSSGASSGYKSSNSIVDLKRLPYKINYKTKVEIFKKEFEDRVESFLEENPKSCGIKLLKSFFNHKYCDSSYKALFVQLENSNTSKEFKDKVFIYHLKTQIQDEMKKSTESPLSIDIHSLLRYEKFKLDFEKNLEDLSSDCQTFWTDLSKDDFKVDTALAVAYKVAGKVITIKQLFTKIIDINPLCIDTSSTYALIYRHMLRDEATFNDLVNKIQQIKNSSKLEQQRELGIRFFDSDIYALLMVSGEIKEIGRIKQANSSTRFVFGYDPKELIGSKINKLMPGPFAQIHDKFLMKFLSQGNSNWLDRNQPLAVLTKDGFLQMTLFYIKPMVSLEFGLVFSCFARKLNLYNMADDSPELVKMHKLCTLLTDSDGFIHCMSDSCSKRLGIPPPSVGSQLSINDNQMFNISQLCPQLLQQDYEFELVKGVKMMVTTNFLKKERQYRREFPEIACKINEYQAELGIHKFIYRDLKQEINIFVLKLADKDDYDYNQNNAFDSDGSKSGGDDDLTYSEFSVTTANSSVISSQMATSKFKTFKSKIQQMESSTHINFFSKISWFTFILLLGIAAGNFAINLIENQMFIQNLDVLTNLQVLLQQIPDSAHSTRQLVLITNGLVRSNDSLISDYGSMSKYSFYSDSLLKASQLFETIQNHLQTSLKKLIQLDQYRVLVKDVETDGDIKVMGQSIQTAINLFSSKIMKMSSYQKGRGGGIPGNTIVPKISFDWKDSMLLNATVNEIQQDLYFIIENGLGSIVSGIHSIQLEKYLSTVDSSLQAGTISLILAAISILLVLILIPISFKPMTQIERVSELILHSLIRLPERFCVNESKACSEITMFLNEQKEGERSTHEMIKKHDHRKNNKQLLKLPKANKKGGLFGQDSMVSSNMESEGSSEAGGLLMGRKETRSVDSNKSSRVTQLSKVKAVDNAQVQRIKRNEAGTIDLDLSLAKTSEIQDEYFKDDEQLIGDKKELTEEEQVQIDRESLRKDDIKSSFKSQRIKKFLWLIVTAIIISIYYAITCFYLSLIHQYERIYLDKYSLIGRKIQCYTNQVSYLIDSLARNSNMTINNNQSAGWYYLEDCFKQEQDYKDMLIDGLTVDSLLDTFNSLNDKLEADQLCKVLSTLPNVDGLRIRNITYNKCLQVYNGILTNGGLTETLYHFLRSQQEVLLLFEDRNARTNKSTDIDVIKRLLMMNETNELITLNQIYLRSAFEYLRNEALAIIQKYFKKLNNYYNLLFGLFVGLLSIFQIIVSAILVKKLTQQIVKIYHVVLLIPFSGRTQNDLNELMIIQL